MRMRFARAALAATALLLFPAAQARAETAEERAAASRSFGLGAQTEFRSNVVGVPSLLFAWEGGWYQVEGSFGLDATDDRTALLPDAYDLGLRFYLPIHRGESADFALTAGGGVTLLDPSVGDLEAAWGAIVGGRVRIFIATNAAVTALAGMGVLFREESTRFGVGALPLGGAGFIYYFR